MFLNTAVKNNDRKTRTKGDDDFGSMKGSSISENSLSSLSGNKKKDKKADDKKGGFVLYDTNTDQEDPIYGFTCWIETETEGKVSARTIREIKHKKDLTGYVLEFYNVKSKEKLTKDNLSKQDFYEALPTNQKVMLENLIKIQDDTSQETNFVLASGSGTMMGSYNQVNPRTKATAQIIDLKDMTKIETLTGGEITSEALFTHEILEGYMGQKEGDDFDNHHNNYGESEQAKADGFKSIDMTSMEDPFDPNKMTGIITAEKQDGTKVVYKILFENGEPTQLISKN